jgi:hypothetical protein
VTAGDTNTAPRTRRAVTTDLNRIERALGGLQHSRACEGWFACTCYVGKVERALERLRSDFGGTSRE